MEKHRTGCPAKSFAEAYKYFSSDYDENNCHIRIGNAAEQIVSEIKTSERFGKILLTGQAGCGKSYVLRQLIKDAYINAAYYPIFVSAAKDMNLTDFEATDFLICIRTKLIHAMQEQQIEVPIRSQDFLTSGQELRQRFIKRGKEMEEHISDLCWTLSGHAHSGYRIDETVLKKLGEEDISENILSRLGSLQDQEYKSEFTFLRTLESLIGELQTLHYKPLFLKHAWIEEKKDVLIIMDDLNHLRRETAEKLFFNAKSMITGLDAKMIFAFPLSLWHYPDFSDLGSHFHCNWLRAISIYDAEGNHRQSQADLLKAVVLQRIDRKLISDNALNALIEISGGILGGIMRNMRNACVRAVCKKASVIDEEIASEVIHNRIDDFARLTDIAKYENTVKTIIRSKKKTEILNKDLIDLLSYSYVLEYGDGMDKVWYDAHPCLTFDGKR